MKITFVFAEYSRTSNNPKIKISVLKCSFKGYNFSTYAEFLNSIPKNSYSESTKRRAILPPPLGKARVNTEFANNVNIETKPSQGNIFSQISYF